MSRFVVEIDRYLRIRTTTGNRVANRALDECEDPFIWSCVNYYERQHERSIAHRLRVEEGWLIAQRGG